MNPKKDLVQVKNHWENSENRMETLPELEFRERHLFRCLEHGKSLEIAINY